MRVLTQCRTVRATSGKVLALLSDVNHPWNAEPISEHSEPSCPERLLKLHFHRPVPCQRVEDALCLRRVLEVQIHREALGLLIRICWYIRALQHVVAHNQGRVNDLVAPLRLDLITFRSFPILHQECDLAAEARFIELKGCFALAVE